MVLKCQQIVLRRQNKQGVEFKTLLNQQKWIHLNRELIIIIIIKSTSVGAHACNTTLTYTRSVIDGGRNEWRARIRARYWNTDLIFKRDVPWMRNCKYHGHKTHTLTMMTLFVHGKEHRSGRNLRTVLLLAFNTLFLRTSFNPETISWISLMFFFCLKNCAT